MPVDKGAYNAATTYSKLDMVHTADSTYVSKVDNNVGHAVTDTNYWTCYASGTAATSAAATANEAAERAEDAAEACEAYDDRMTRVETSIVAVEAVDLSYLDINGNYNHKRNTANCYVVKKNGRYKLPLVYGNGIKNGEINTAAFTKIEGDTVADFVNHLGNVITTPYIEEMAGCRAESALLVWCEAQNVISGLQIVEGQNGPRELVFNVANFPATGANAIIGIADEDGNCIWSWHIWLYPDALTTIEFENHTEQNYNLLNVNLGWTWDDTNKNKGKNVHYQWGRKDPMLSPASATSTSNHAAYGDKNFGTLDVAEEKTVANAIAKPWLFFIQYDDTLHNWNNLEYFYNFWDANCAAAGASDNVTVKTIYDPSPVGFKVPNGRTFTGFTTTGSNSSNPEEFNVVGSFDKGWKFKANADDADGQFFAASGYRYSSSGGLLIVSGYGYYWSSAASSQTFAYYLCFYSGYVSPLYNSSRASGFSVRAVQE